MKTRAVIDILQQIKEQLLLKKTRSANSDYAAGLSYAITVIDAELKQLQGKLRRDD